jgi:hypothetical protein
MNREETIKKHIQHLERMRSRLLRQPRPDYNEVERIESKIESLTYQLDALEYATGALIDFN